MRTSRRELTAMQINGNRKRGGAVSRRRRTTILAGAVCTALVALAFAGTASAKIVNLRAYNGPYPAGAPSTAPARSGPGGDALLVQLGAPDGHQPRQRRLHRRQQQLLVQVQLRRQRRRPSRRIAPPPMVGTIRPEQLGRRLGRQLRWQPGGSAKANRVGSTPVGRRRHDQRLEGEWRTRIRWLRATRGARRQRRHAASTSTPEGNVWAGSWTGGPITEFNPDGTPTGESFNSRQSRSAAWRSTTAGNFYIS